MIPSGAKAPFWKGSDGTAKAVPLQRILETFSDAKAVPFQRTLETFSDG